MSLALLPHWFLSLKPPPRDEEHPPPSPGQGIKHPPHSPEDKKALTIPGEKDIAILSSPAIYDRKFLDFMPGTQSVIDSIFLLQKNMGEKKKEKSLEKSHGEAKTFSTLCT